jgi:hemin uptake protein HemP
MLKGDAMSASTHTQDAPTHDAKSLMAGGDHAPILLSGQAYLLHVTRTGKLILTK